MAVGRRTTRRGNQPMSEDKRQQALLQRAVEGDPQATEELLWSHYDRLHQFIEKNLPPVVRSTLSANDILQETFVVAWQQIGSFEDRHPLPSTPGCGQLPKTNSPIAYGPRWPPSGAGAGWPCKIVAARAAWWTWPSWWSPRSGAPAVQSPTARRSGSPSSRSPI